MTRTFPFSFVVVVYIHMSWGSRNTVPATHGSGRHYIFTGRAYPRIQAGSNPTRIITADRRDRDQFYHDPAVTLSDADMDAFDGTEGSPLCVEHETKDVVGVVRHSWIGDGQDRALKIIGRISLDTERGRTIAAQVRAGVFKGLSVGYATEIADGNKMCGKEFREISLVAEPFFPNCNIASYGVTASKHTINNPAYNGRNEMLQLQIVASKTTAIGMDGQQQTTGGGQPTGAPPVSPDELLRETDKLKTQVEQERQQRALESERMKQYEAKLKYFEEKEAQEAAAYAKEQEPKAAAYIDAVAASRGGKPLPESMQKAYRETFCNPALKEAARELEDHTKSMVELMASKKLADERAAAAEAQTKTFQSAVNKTTEILNHSRSNFADALRPEEDDAAARRKTVVATADVNASNLSLNHIMVPHPSATELDFLKAYGYSTTYTGVTASASGERALTRSVPVAASHRLLKDAEGNPQFGASWRNLGPGSAAMFSWMCNQDELRSEGGDISDVVTLNASKELYLRKATDPMAIGQSN